MARGQHFADNKIDDPPVSHNGSNIDNSSIANTYTVYIRDAMKHPAEAELFSRYEDDSDNECEVGESRVAAGAAVSQVCNTQWWGMYDG